MEIHFVRLIADHRSLINNEQDIVHGIESEGESGIEVQILLTENHLMNGERLMPGIP